MNKKSVEPDEMRMPADKFDELMRHALGALPPSEEPASDKKTQEEFAKKLAAKRKRRKC